MADRTAPPRSRPIRALVTGWPEIEDATSWRGHFAARHFVFVISAGVVLTFIISMLSVDTVLWLPAAPLFLAGYAAYIASKEVLRSQLGAAYYRSPLQILRAQGIIAVTTILLAYLHHHGAADQYLWLFYILGALVVSEHCDTHWLFATLVEIFVFLFGLALFFPPTGAENPWQQAIARALWIGILSFVVHFLVRNVEIRDEQQRQHIAAQKRAAARMDALWQVGQKITSVLDQDALLHSIVDIVSESFGYSRVHVLLLDVPGQRLVFKAGTGQPGQVLAEQGFRLPLGQGITSWVATHREPVLANDVQSDPRYYRHELLSSVRAELAAPIIFGDRVLGVLDVESDTPGAFAEDDLLTMRVLADQIALALNNAESYARSQRHAAEMEDFYQAGLTTAAARDLDEAVNAIYSEAVQLLQVRTFYIALWQRGREEIRFELLVDDGKRLRPFSRPMVAGFGLTEYILQTGTPLLLNSVEDAERLPVQPIQVGGACASYVGEPLIARDEVLGVIAMQSVEPGAFTAEHVEALHKLAKQAAPAIDSVLRYEQAVANERTRLSRELHDSVTQYVSSIKLMAETGAVYVQTDPEQAQERMETIQTVAQTALNEIRLHIHDLRQPALRGEAFLGAVREYLGLLKDYYGIDVELKDTGAPQLGQQVGEQLYHVIQEALHNVAKHAHAKHASVSLAFDRSGVDVVVEDDGRGFDLAALEKAEQKQGLLNMDYRVRQLGGQFWVESAPSKGTRIGVSVPLRPAAARAGRIAEQADQTTMVEA